MLEWTQGLNEKLKKQHEALTAERNSLIKNASELQLKKAENARLAAEAGNNRTEIERLQAENSSLTEQLEK